MILVTRIAEHEYANDDENKAAVVHHCECIVTGIGELGHLESESEISSGEEVASDEDGYPRAAIEKRDNRTSVAMAVTVNPDVAESDYEAQQNVDGAHVNR